MHLMGEGLKEGSESYSNDSEKRGEIALQNGERAEL